MRNDATDLFDSLSPSERWAIGDAFVLGEAIDWMGLGLEGEPDKGFQRTLARLIQDWEDS